MQSLSFYWAFERIPLILFFDQALISPLNLAERSRPGLSRSRVCDVCTRVAARRKSVSAGLYYNSCLIFLARSPSPSIIQLHSGDADNSQSVLHIRHALI